MRLARRDQRSLLSVSRPHAGPISLSAVVDALHCVRARHGRQLATATCGALPSKGRLRAAALRSPLRYTLRPVPSFRSRLPTLRPKRPRTDCPQSQPSNGGHSEADLAVGRSVLLRQARRKERNHPNGLPVRLIYTEIKRLEARSRTAAIRQARKSPRPAAALQRRASLVGNGKWRITNLRDVVKALSNHS